MKGGLNSRKRVIFTVLSVLCLITVIAVNICLFIGYPDTGINSGKLAKVYASKPTHGFIEIHCLDVDQADSTLIRSVYGNILIDTGTNDSEETLRAHLRACGISKIDYLICTHPHSDHIGGADMVIDEFSVGTVLMTDAETTDISFQRLLDSIESRRVNAEIPNVGDTYSLGNIGFTVLAPVNESDDLNQMSLIIKLTFGETSFLFMGDAEQDAELSMLEHHGTDTLDCDYLKVGHHGSATSSCERFLEAVSPNIASISCGMDNSYGHPRGEVLDRLSKSGCETVLRTDVSGTTVITSDGESLVVTVS